MATRDISPPVAPIVLGDWGTSRLRLFLNSGDRTIDQVEGPGIGSQKGLAVETLRICLTPWIDKYGPKRIVMCGMAGSRNGLVETPYAHCPIDALKWAHSAINFTSGPLPITMAAGLACAHYDGTPDVMRGEETQIFGALTLHHEFDATKRLIVLPGTHTKWAWLVDGKIVDFCTYITGEMFAVLRDHSTLAQLDGDDIISDDGFLNGLERAEKKAVLGTLFEVRAAQLRAGRSRSWALGFLSGLLIGHEVKEALTDLGSPCEVSLIGDPSLTSRYRTAFARLQIRSVEFDGDTCVVAGLRSLAGITPMAPQC